MEICELPKEQRTQKEERIKDRKLQFGGGKGTKICRKTKNQKIEKQSFKDRKPRLGKKKFSRMGWLLVLVLLAVANGEGSQLLEKKQNKKTNKNTTISFLTKVNEVKILCAEIFSQRGMPNRSHAFFFESFPAFKRDTFCFQSQYIGVQNLPQFFKS